MKEMIAAIDLYAGLSTCCLCYNVVPYLAHLHDERYDIFRVLPIRGVEEKRIGLVLAEWERQIRQTPPKDQDVSVSDSASLCSAG